MVKLKMTPAFYKQRKEYISHYKLCWEQGNTTVLNVIIKIDFIFHLPDKAVSVLHEL